jgi:hypothetical protein
MNEQRDIWGQTSPPKGDESRSTRDVAREEVGNVANTAADHGGQVAQTARKQGSRVASEATQQLRDLTDQARAQVAEQAGSQQQRAADGLRRLGDELESMSESSAGGTAQQLVRGASEQLGRVAEWLDGGDPEGLLDDVRGFARRHPGKFLLVAGAAGVVAGRATRSGVEVARSDDEDAPTAESAEPTQPDLESSGVASGMPYPTGQPTDFTGTGANRPSSFDESVPPTDPTDPIDPIDPARQGHYR